MDGEGERIDVSEMLGASGAAALRRAILAAGGDGISIDLGGAGRVSTQSLQVLLSAAITARASGRRLTLHGADDALPWLAQAGLTLADLQAGPLPAVPRPESRA
ncbi:MAG: STAS domain-containing protein [Hasllibacter sp.]